MTTNKERRLARQRESRAFAEVMRKRNLQARRQAYAKESETQARIEGERLAQRPAQKREEREERRRTMKKSFRTFVTSAAQPKKLAPIRKAPIRRRTTTRKAPIRRRTTTRKAPVRRRTTTRKAPVRRKAATQKAPKKNNFDNILNYYGDI